MSIQKVKGWKANVIALQVKIEAAENPNIAAAKNVETIATEVAEAASAAIMSFIAETKAICKACPSIQGAKSKEENSYLMVIACRENESVWINNRRIEYLGKEIRQRLIESPGYIIEVKKCTAEIISNKKELKSRAAALIKKQLLGAHESCINF